MKRLCSLLLPVLFLTQCRHKQETTTIRFPGKPEVPLSVQKEHEDLLDKIQRITLFRDSAGRAAIKLNELMKHHFAEEEDYVLPPLGLLPLLADGKIPEQSKEILLLTEKIKSQMSHLSAEHQMIKAYLDELIQAPTDESHPEIAELEKALHKHANSEEDILFPAAILVGEYLKLKPIARP